MRKLVDKKLFYILVGYAFAYLLYTSLRGAILKLIDYGNYGQIGWTELLFDHIIANIFIMPPTILLIIYVTKYFLDRQYNWKVLITIHFLLSILYIVVIYFLYFTYQIVIGDREIESISKEFFLKSIIVSSNLHFLGYIGFVAIIYSYYYINQYAKIELQKTQLAQQFTNVKLEMLKAQLNPHFLFNTLHSISSLVKEDPDKAQNMLVSLGDLLREIIFIKHEDKITVEKELDILRKYIDIMLIRFSDHLNINIQVDDSIKKALIPSLLTQPIIENSLKYGYSANHTHLEIKMAMFVKERKLIIQIENDGKPLEKDTAIRYGTGLKNINERLETLYGNKFSFTFKSQEDGEGVITVISIPFEI